MIEKIHKFYLMRIGPRLSSVALEWIGALGLLVLLPACEVFTPVDQTLPASSVVGVRRGRHFERVITHFHSSYSFDACDGHGTVTHPDGTITPNLKCEEDLETALCLNQIDSLFLSDHVPHMAEVPLEQLLFTSRSEEQIHSPKGEGVAKLMTCKNGHKAFFAPGLEGRLLALGMERHVGADYRSRRDLYSDDAPSSVGPLQKIAEAVVVIPHTESKSLELIQRSNADALEIYNLHANFDPNIRRNYLHVAPFSHLFSFLDYLMDPYHDLNPDYLFLDFMQFFPVYFDRWDHAIASGHPMTGLGGTDAHQNTFSQHTTDGERLDSYRRLSRFMAHFVLVENSQTEPYAHYRATKDSLRQGLVYLVVEGLGTPVDFDFYAIRHRADPRSPPVEMGQSVRQLDEPILAFDLPKVYEQSPGVARYGQPKIKVDLVFVDRQGQESVVDSVTREAHHSYAPFQKLVYPKPTPGAYRIQVWMTPRHLRGVVRKGELTEKPYLWMISNPIYVTE